MPSEVRSRRQQVQGGNPDIPFPGDTLQKGYTIPPASSGSFTGAPPDWTCPAVLAKSTATIYSPVLWRWKPITNLDKLQVGEGSDVEVRCVLLRRDAVVELTVAAANRERLGPVGSAQRGCSVQPADVGRWTKLCKHAHIHEKLATAPLSNAKTSVTSIRQSSVHTSSKKSKVFLTTESCDVCLTSFMNSWLCDVNADKCRPLKHKMQCGLKRRLTSMDE